MKKRFLALLLALVLVLGMLPAAALAADSDFTIENGVLTKYNGSGGDVEVPEGVTEIGNWAFLDCTGLTSVTIPDSVTSIGLCAFSGCTGLTAVTIPNGVTYIGDLAFSGCTGLTAVNLSDSVTEIWYSAFFNCTGLTDIQVSAGNQTHASIDGALFSKDLKTLERYPAGRKGAYTIPDSVTSIGIDAFCGCTGLTGVTIPDSVTNIELEAFCGCTGLTSVTIPDSVTEIGQQAFSGCTGLTGVVIPDSVTGIGDWAFSNCTGLTSVVIPGSVASIELCAFQDCTGLTSVTIHNGVADIGYSAFQGCTGLTSVTIPDSVIFIGTFAFYGCNDLKDICYSGTEAQWGAIKIDVFGNFRNDLHNTTIHYNSTGPDQPQQPTTPTEPTTPATLPTVEDIPATGTAVARTQTVKLDGRDVEFQCYAVKNAAGDETNYVKVRDLAMALNGTKAQFNVAWDGQIGITSGAAYKAVGGEGATPYSGDQPYRAVSDTPVRFNGSAVRLTSFSITYQGGGYTYYKLRDLGQLLGFNVKWDGTSVVIETDKPYTGK